MKIHLNIPRNTWVKSPELNMEITGDLDLVKADENIELFGTLRTIRGTYDIFGRRFDVQEGQINFVGGEKINPQVNITALYIFRTLDREKRKLKLNITGEAFNPSIEFSLDGARIEEADAISYLIFGKSIDQLSHGQKSELSENQGLVSQSTVRNVLAGQLAGHLTEELQQSMNLDIIEFKGEQNWRRATVVIGKYITEDIFVSYERTINLGETSSVVPEEINLEYELTRYLFIRANKSSEKESGFDFIFKFEKE
jgi:autotransporter translocation and assembly factor TamB